MKNITVRLELQEFTAGPYDQSRMRTQLAASSDATMPRLAFNRKDTGSRINGDKGRIAADLSQSVWFGFRSFISLRAGSIQRISEPKLPQTPHYPNPMDFQRPFESAGSTPCD